ncbi:MAG: 2-oxoglutarate dehydrogenase complex dihydrolipoyllysine-residue succinyltransferase [Acidobacteria bacterium]|nr:2-oxoglutarate dehydrogenase complex dihydrolipoyllysine-residue succinyltransferase [Acidobacteriota bacterium]
MSVELTVPEVGESITEVQIGRWLKADGDTVARDEDLVEIETEKASVVVPAPEAGVLKILVAEGAFAEVGDAIAQLGEGSGEAPTTVPMEAREEAPAATLDEPVIMPAAARLLAEHGIDASEVETSGPGGRLLKEDVERFMQSRDARAAAREALEETAAPAPAAEPAAEATTEPAATEAANAPAAATPPERGEEVRPMSMIRRTIANRLVEAQQNAALLTTFNEVDMAPVKELRAKYKEQFEKQHGARLGFMSFFVKASVEALRRFPAVNAEVRGTEVVYRDYYDIGIAIGGGKGLVVPVLRNAESKNFAEIETSIADLGARAQANQIEPDELAGGTFTISNGGVYGSLLSTPIVNPPQSGILGMHTIQDRPVAINGDVVIRPMMYVALTYDHRIIDGREAVTFLRTIKDVLEDPARLLLEI